MAQPFAIDVEIKLSKVKGEIMKFKKTDIIATVLQKHPKGEEILSSFGFHCLYCPCSQMETLEQACEVHEVNVDDVLEALNKKG